MKGESILLVDGQGELPEAFVKLVLLVGLHELDQFLKIKVSQAHPFLLNCQPKGQLLFLPRIKASLIKTLKNGQIPELFLVGHAFFHLGLCHGLPKKLEIEIANLQFTALDAAVPNADLIFLQGLIEGRKLPIESSLTDEQGLGKALNGKLLLVK